jgi:hypothetical protein
VWKQANVVKPVLPSPVTMGWSLDGDRLIPLLMTLDPIPQACLEMISRGANLKKLRRAGGDAKMFGVFRVKNHDFTPKNNIFANFRGAHPAPPSIHPCFVHGQQTSVNVIKVNMSNVLIIGFSYSRKRTK